MYGMQAKRGTSLNSYQRKWLAVTALLIFLLDYASKELAIKFLSDGSVDVIGDLLRFNLVFNPGAAFSLASNATIFLSAFAIAIAVVIFYYGRKVRSTPWAVALGLALGGIFGNLTDRIFREPGPLRGEVVDWIQLPNWPIFNIADSAVVSAAVLITILSIKNIEFYGPTQSDEKEND